MKKIRKYILEATLFFLKVFLAILLINPLIHGLVLGANSINELYSSGGIIKFGNRAWVFAHGSYHVDCESFQKNCTIYHSTSYKYDNYVTANFLEKLHEEGFDKIWVAMCGTGNHNYSIKYPNGTEIAWKDYVIRNKFKGEIAPIFTGLAFTHLAI